MVSHGMGKPLTSRSFGWGPLLKRNSYYWNEYRLRKMTTYMLVGINLADDVLNYVLGLRYRLQWHVAVWVYDQTRLGIEHLLLHQQVIFLAFYQRFPRRFLPNLDLSQLVYCSKFVHWIRKILDDLPLLFVKNCQNEMHASQQRNLHGLFDKSLLSFVQSYLNKNIG